MSMEPVLLSLFRQSLLPMTVSAGDLRKVLVALRQTGSPVVSLTCKYGRLRMQQKWLWDEREWRHAHSPQYSVEVEAMVTPLEISSSLFSGGWASIREMSQALVGCPPKAPVDLSSDGGVLHMTVPPYHTDIPFPSIDEGTPHTSGGVDERRWGGENPPFGAHQYCFARDEWGAMAKSVGVRDVGRGHTMVETKDKVVVNERSLFGGGIRFSHVTPHAIRSVHFDQSRRVGTPLKDLYVLPKSVVRVVDKLAGEDDITYDHTCRHGVDKVMISADGIIILALPAPLRRWRFEKDLLGPADFALQSAGAGATGSITVGGDGFRGAYKRVKSSVGMGGFMKMDVRGMDLRMVGWRKNFDRGTTTAASTGVVEWGDGKQAWGDQQMGMEISRCHRGLQDIPGERLRISRGGPHPGYICIQSLGGLNHVSVVGCTESYYGKEQDRGKEGEGPTAQIRHSPQHGVGMEI